MNREMLEGAAALMRAYHEADQETREFFALRMASLAVRETLTLEERREINDEEHANFELVNDLVSLLPQAEGKYSEFTLANIPTLRSVQANVADTSQITHSDSRHYVIGDRPMVVPGKKRIQFTEVLLWPASKESHDYYEKTVKLWPRSVAVPTAQYETFKELGRKLSREYLSSDEMEEVFDTETGNLKIGRAGLGISEILHWWHKKGWTSRLTGYPETAVMATPKSRWGYESKIYEDILPDRIMIDFGLLGRLASLMNDFGQGEAAADLIEQRLTA